MTVTTWTLTGDLLTWDGKPYPLTGSTPISGYVTASADAFQDAGHATLLGPTFPLAIAADGSFSATGIPDSSETGQSYTVTVTYRPAGHGRPRAWTSDPFTVNASGRFDEMPFVPPDISEAQRLAALTDAQVAALVADGDSLTQASLTAIRTSYNPGASGLAATNVQAAIDEVAGRTLADPAEYVRGALAARSPSLNLAIAADSTGDGSTEWVGNLASRLAAEYPHLNVVRKNWNGTTHTWDADTTVQAGTGPTIAYGPTRRDTFARTAPDIIGTPTEIGATNWADGGGSGQAALNWSADGTSAVAGAHSTRAPILVSAGQTGSSRHRHTYTFGDLTGARQVDHFIRRASDTNRLYIITAMNAGGGTVYVALCKRIGGTTTTIANLGAVTTPGDKTFTIEATVTVNGDGSAAVAATVNGQSLTGSLSSSDWTAVNGGFNVGLYVVNGTPTGDRWKLFEFAPATEVFAQQTLTLYNCAKTGSTIDYQTTHIATAYPDATTFHQLWVASSHNEGSGVTPAAYEARILEFADAFHAAHPDVPMVLSSQNSQFPPGQSAANIAAHRLRCLQLRSLAARRGWGYVPVIETWDGAPDGGVLLVSSTDGVHPTTGSGSGSELWGGAAFDWLT